jgi:hypothetical protein
MNQLINNNLFCKIIQIKGYFSNLFKIGIFLILIILLNCKKEIKSFSSKSQENCKILTPDLRTNEKLDKLYEDICEILSFYQVYKNDNPSSVEVEELGCFTVSRTSFMANDSYNSRYLFIDKVQILQNVKIKSSKRKYYSVVLQIKIQQRYFDFQKEYCLIGNFIRNIN